MSKQPTPKLRRSQRGSVEDRWRARYVDNAGREHSRRFDRKVEAQQWRDKQSAALLRGGHVAPSHAKMTVGSGVTSG